MNIHNLEPNNPTLLPDIMIPVRSAFGIDSDLEVPGFSERDEHVPEIDSSYCFNHDVTLALLAGFAKNRRVLVQGFHANKLENTPSVSVLQV